jgi:hypothetical protein
MMNDEEFNRLTDAFLRKDLAAVKKIVIYEPWVFKVTQDWNDQYLYAEQEYNPHYMEQTDMGPALVHPGLLLNQSSITRCPSFHILEKMASVHSMDELEWVNPPRVGKTFTVNWELVDIYEKRGKLFSTVTATIIDEDKTLIMRRKAHGVFSIGR